LTLSAREGGAEQRRGDRSILTDKKDFAYLAKIMK